MHFHPFPSKALAVAETHEPSPPDVAALGEGGGLDDLGGHPGVGAGSAHLGGLVPLPCQAEVGDLQRQTLHTFVLYGLCQEDWGVERERQVRNGSTTKRAQRFKMLVRFSKHSHNLFTHFFSLPLFFILHRFNDNNTFSHIA